MQQEQLFFDSVDDAIGNTVQALGGFKAVAIRLWPTMKLESAYAKLKACLDPAKDRENLDQHEINSLVQWGAEVGNYAIPRWFAEQAAGEYKPVAQVERAADLQQRFDTGLQELRQIVDRMEKLPKQGRGRT